MIDRRQGREGKPSLSGTRGQTLQDYTIGISLFLITVAAVLAGLLGFTSPLTAGVSAEDISQSERVSTAMVGNHSTGRQPNELDASQLSTTMNQPVEQLRTRWGIERTTSLNVSLVTLNGTRIVDRGGNELAVGASATNRSTATASRIVTLDDGTCDPSCRL
ncbi:hypothetical protein BRC78_03880, partial [Halobacteriales archaeon QH_8_68_33]